MASNGLSSLARVLEGRDVRLIFKCRRLEEVCHVAHLNRHHGIGTDTVTGRCVLIQLDGEP